MTGLLFRLEITAFHGGANVSFLDYGNVAFFKRTSGRFLKFVLLLDKQVMMQMCIRLHLGIRLLILKDINGYYTSMPIEV